MGDRATYAVRNGGAAEVFFGHWGAASLLPDIFWGPVTTEALIRSQEPTTQWLDDVFGEAAVAMCHDTRTVAFYDGRYDEAAQRLAARLMRATWPGWTVRAERYVSGVAATIGVDTLARAEPDAQSTFDATRRLHELGSIDGAPPRAGLVHATRNRETTTRISAECLTAFLRCGPTLLLALPALPTIDEVRAALEGLADAAGRPVAVLDDGPLVLVAVDEDARTLAVTIAPGMQAAGHAAALRDLAERWPGWDVTVRIDSPASHFTRLGATWPDDLLEKPVDAPLAGLLRELAVRILGADAFKESATRWLTSVARTTGIPLPPPEASLVQVDAGTDPVGRFEAAVRSLELDEDTIARATSLAERAHRAGAPKPERFPAGSRDPMGVIQSSMVRVGDTRYALFQALDDGGVPIGASELLAIRDGDAEPRAHCNVSEAPIWAKNTTGIPGSATLDASPSGRSLVAVVETNPYRLIWIDIASARATCIGEASRVARFDRDLGVAWDVSPGASRDRVAFEVRDTTIGRFGTPIAVAFDEAIGPLLERAAATAEAWDDRGLTLRTTSADRTAFVSATLAVPSAPEPATAPLARARLGLIEPDGEHGVGPTLEAAQRIAAAVRSDRLLATDPVGAAEHDLASVDALVHAAAHLRKHRRHAELEALTARHLAVVPTSRSGWLERSVALQNTGDPHGAVAAADRAVEVAPCWALAHWQRACALVSATRLDDAARAASRAAELDSFRTADIATDPDFEPLWGRPSFLDLDIERHVAAGARAQGDEALRAYERALALDPTRASSHARLVRAIPSVEASLEAIGAWEAAIPGDPEPGILRGELLLDEGRTGEARAVFERHRDRWPDEPYAHIHLARLAKLAGDASAAAEHLEAAAQRWGRGARQGWPLGEYVGRFDELREEDERGDEEQDEDQKEGEEEDEEEDQEEDPEREAP